MKKIKFFNKKTLYTVTTVLMLVVLLFASYLGTTALDTVTKENDLKLDFTKEKLFTLSDATKLYISSLKEKIEIKVLENEVNYKMVFPHQTEIIKNYMAANSEMISVEFIDAQVDPTFINQYRFEDVELGDIMIFRGDRYYVVRSSSLYSTETDEYTGQSIEYSKAETAMNTAILFVSATDRYRIGFIEGHGETINTEFVAFLKNNIFEVESVDLKAAKEISHINILISNGALYDFSEDELRKLDEYMYNGGKFDRNIVITTALTKSDTPNLDAFLKEYGLVYTNDIVYENMSSRYYMGDKLATYAEVPLGESVYGLTLANQEAGEDYMLVAPYSRRLQFTQPISTFGTVTTRSILDVSGYAALTDLDKAIDTSVAFVPGDNDPEGIYSVGAVSRLVSSDSSESRVFLYGSMNLISDAAIVSRDMVNKEYIMSVLKTLVDRPFTSEYDIYVDPTNITGELFVPADTVAIILIFVLIILPIVTVVATGITTFVRRRHR